MVFPSHDSFRIAKLLSHKIAALERLILLLRDMPISAHDPQHVTHSLKGFPQGLVRTIDRNFVPRQGVIRDLL